MKLIYKFGLERNNNIEIYIIDSNDGEWHEITLEGGNYTYDDYGNVVLQLVEGELILYDCAAVKIVEDFQTRMEGDSGSMYSGKYFGYYIKLTDNLDIKKER